VEHSAPEVRIAWLADETNKELMLSLQGRADGKRNVINRRRRRKPVEQNERAYLYCRAFSDARLGWEDLDGAAPGSMRNAAVRNEE